MGRTFKQVDETERRLVKNMRKEKLTWEVIQRITGRSPDTLNSIINPKASTPKTKGQPKKIPVKVLPKVLKVMTRLQKKAKAEEGERGAEERERTAPPTPPGPSNTLRSTASPRTPSPTADTALDGDMARLDGVPAHLCGWEAGSCPLSAAAEPPP